MDVEEIKKFLDEQYDPKRNVAMWKLQNDLIDACNIIATMLPKYERQLIIEQMQTETKSVSK